MRGKSWIKSELSLQSQNYETEVKMMTIRMIKFKYKILIKYRNDKIIKSQLLGEVIMGKSQNYDIRS